MATAAPFFRRMARLDPARCAAVLLLGIAALLSSGTAAAQEWRYRVRPGDTVWDLAGKYLRNDIPWQRLQGHNRIQDPYRLQPGLTMRFPVDWLRQAPAKARVIGLHGDATVQQPDARQSPITEGMELGIGAIVRTAPGASLTLRFADGSRLLLQGGSELVLDRLSAYGATGMTDTRLRLPRGRSRSEVEPMHGPASHFIVETPSTMSSVRGTRFRIASDGIHSQTEVTDGRVAVDGGGARVMLLPGQGTISAADDRPLEPRALLPAPASLTLDATRRPMRLQWAPVAGARAYRVEVGATPEFLSLLHDRVVTATQETLPALSDGLYGLRVRAIDANGIEGLDAVIESRVVLPPPFALAPIEGGIVDAERPRFRWASMGPAVRYRFQLAGDEGFAEPLLDLTGLTDHDMRSPQALPPGDYVWRIAAIDGEGRMSRFNDDVHFSVLAPAPGPQATRATDTDKRTLHVRWPAAGPEQHFRFQLAREPDFAHVEVDRELEHNEIVLPDLRAGTWHARVQVVDSDGHARAFGPSQSFKVGCFACRLFVGGGILLLLLTL